MCMLCQIVHAVQKSWGGFGQHTRLAQQIHIVKAMHVGQVHSTRQKMCCVDPGLNSRKGRYVMSNYFVVEGRHVYVFCITCMKHFLHHSALYEATDKWQRFRLCSI